jgi:hypothetical protein
MWEAVAASRLAGLKLGNARHPDTGQEDIYTIPTRTFDLVSFLTGAGPAGPDPVVHVSMAIPAELPSATHRAHWDPQTHSLASVAFSGEVPFFTHHHARYSRYQPRWRNSLMKLCVVNLASNLARRARRSTSTISLTDLFGSASLFDSS